MAVDRSVDLEATVGATGEATTTGDELVGPGASAELQRLALGISRSDAELSVEEYIKRHCIPLAKNFNPDYPDDIAQALLEKASAENVAVEQLQARIARTAEKMRPYHLFLRANVELIGSPMHEASTREFYRLAARHGAFEPDADVERLKQAYAAEKQEAQEYAGRYGYSSARPKAGLALDVPKDALAFSRQSAVYTLHSTRATPRPSMWPRLEWRHVMSQAIERVKNPFSTDIDGPYFCGPTFTLSVFIEKEPERYAATVIEVMTKGTFAGRTISAELRAANPDHSYGEFSVDWMMMSALRNTHPNMFGRYKGEDEEDYASDDKGTLISRLGKQERSDYANIRAGTSVSQMRSDIEAVLGYDVVESAYFWQEDVIADVAPNRFVKSGLKTMMDLLPATYDADTPYIAAILIGMGSSGSGNRMTWDDKKSWGTQIGTNVDAIHWLRVVTKPKKTGDSYEFEMFQHGDKSATTYTEQYLNEDVYGYVIARRPAGR